MTVLQLLRDALVLLETPLPHEWCDCARVLGLDLGPWCVRCALATAATNDYAKRSASMTLSELLGETMALDTVRSLEDAVGHFVPLPDDRPLIEACALARPFIGTGRLERDQAVAAIARVIRAVERRPAV